VSIRLIYRGSVSGLRIALLSFAAIAGFVTASALLLFVLPAPHTRVQYLFAGTAPTVMGLLWMLAQAHRERSRPRSWAMRHQSS